MNDSIESPVLLYDDRISVNKLIYFGIKRLFDILLSLIGVVLLIPLIIIIKISFLLTGDTKSIFYSQDRFGKDGKIFRLYKFRSMVVDADSKLNNILKNKKLKKEYEEIKKLEHDPRVTKVGRILRKTSIDEMPQFINILKGDMSLIGNRPYLLKEMSDMRNYYNDILKTKPGLTGYWQVNLRSRGSFKERLKMEQYYSNNCSLLFDIKIFFKTFSAVISGKGSK